MGTNPSPDYPSPKIIHWVSLPILAEIIGKSEKKLRKQYQGLIQAECVPLSALPLEQQNAYADEYLLRDRLIDLDLQRLIRDPKDCIPLLAPEIQAFFKETAMIRQAFWIANTYAADGSVTSRLTELALSNGMSYRTLARKRRIFMNQSSLMKLMDNPSQSEDTKDRYPTCCFYARDFIICRHFHSGRLSGNLIFGECQEAVSFPCAQCPYHPSNRNKTHHKNDFVPQATCHRNRETIQVPNLRDTVNLIIRRIPEQEVCLAWEGVRSWASKYNYTPSRKKPQLVNHVWFSDHTKLDIWVITGKNSDGSPKSERVWLTAILDAATNALVGYALSIHPNSSTIAEAFARACAFKVNCPYYGLPEFFYIDNGRDYCANHLKGLPNDQQEHLYLNKEFAESGILEWFGVRVIHSLPYRGCSKTIEAIWSTIESQWICRLPGYCGCSPQTRPITIEEDRKRGRLYTFQQFADYLADVIYPAYNNYKMTNEEPNVLYDRLPKANTCVPTWKTLAVLKARTEMRTIHQDGIHFQNHKYWCAALAPFIRTETKVRVFAFDSPFNRSLSIVLGSVYIGEAHLIDSLNVVEDRRYRVIQHLQEQQAHYKTLSTHIKAVHSLILQSDILDRATHIPPIDNVLYAQAIDEEKDASVAQDDSRIPVELKEQAIKYLNLAAEEPESPGVASLFFQQLAEQVLNREDKKE